MKTLVALVAVALAVGCDVPPEETSGKSGMPLTWPMPAEQTELVQQAVVGNSIGYFRDNCTGTGHVPQPGEQMYHSEPEYGGCCTRSKVNVIDVTGNYQNFNTNEDHPVTWGACGGYVKLSDRPPRSMRTRGGNTKAMHTRVTTGYNNTGTAFQWVTPAGLFTSIPNMGTIRWVGQMVGTTESN